ncbi:MAG TPA: cation transporter [Microlunatus sp.]|nr:cation transporter [Microlunatus sp.]
MPLIAVHVPWMTDRVSVRAVTATVRDVAGVDSVEVDVTAAILTVRGQMDETALLCAIAATGPNEG